MTDHRKKLIRMILSALFLALCYVLPFLTGQIPEIGARLCPMHIPVLLCGFFCGPIWGLAVGFIAPLLRSVTIGMPPLFPSAVCMAFELAAYGAVAGVMHRLLPRKKPFVYLSLITAMLAGRVVWGIVTLLCAGISQNSFTLSAFLASAFTNAIPGIIIQIVFIPIIVMILDNPKISLIRD